MATSTTAMQISMIPRYPMPCCLRMFPPVLMERAETFQFAEVEPDKKRLADYVLFRDETPHPAVGRIVAVVAHHEIMPRRNGANHASIIVVAIVVQRECMDKRHCRGR